MESQTGRTTRLESRSRAVTSANTGVPALLVSVRNATEALAAVNGGCDILDVKEPSRGPLGMAAAAEIRAILAIRDAAAREVPVSVALGELHEWQDTALVFEHLRGVSFLKFGTSRLCGADLSRHFKFARSKFETPSSLDSPGSTGCGLVPVAYADWKSAGASHPREVAEAALATGCDGLLIDTYCKTGPGVFESLSVLELTECATVLKRAGKSFALAGRLCRDDLGGVLDLEPDILGIRSAACREGQRDLEIDEHAVRQFRQALRRVAHTRSVPAAAAGVRGAG